MKSTEIEIRNCKNCQSEYQITESDIEFYKKISPVINGERFLIPLSQECEECRMQRVLTFRNESKLYRRTCDLSGKPIISNYSLDKELIVYSDKEWWGDNWNPLATGMDFDFSKTFFDQYEELMKKAPIINLVIGGGENSNFTNFTWSNNNCYMIYASDYNENVMYANNIFKSKDSIDCYFTNEVELCYEGVDLEKCFKCFYCLDCKNCSNCQYCFDCKNCSDCIGCTNLVNGKYCVLNKQYSKEKYNELQAESHKLQAMLDEDIDKIKAKMIHLYANIINCQNSSGNNISNCNNCINCYDLMESEDCRNSALGINSKDCHDSVGVAGANLVLGGVAVPEDSNIRFCSLIRPSSSNLFYCYSCSMINDCFGCVGLKDKQFCILNKQYTKEEYEKLLVKIIEHMYSTGERGKFFSKSMTPFCYNETIAQEYYPLTKEVAISKGFKWMDKEYLVDVPEGMETIPGSSIDELQASSHKLQAILDKAIICEKSGKPYRILKSELDFYIKYNIELPKLHPEQRHLQRMKKRSPRKLFDRNCYKCADKIMSPYSPEREDIIYCEKCYNENVY